MAYDLKPFAINLNDLIYLLQQVNFVPLFDGPANSNGIVNFNSNNMDAYDSKGNLVWDWETQSGNYQGTALTATNVGLLGQGFPQVSAPIGVRDVSGLHNNLFGDQAFWGSVDVPFRRDIAADFTNYITNDGLGGVVDYTPGNSVIDYMPRIISRLTTTAGVNLLTDVDGHYVNWDSARYASDSVYAALVDASNVVIANLVEGAKIVAPVDTEVAILDGNGDPLVWTAAEYGLSAIYTTTLAGLANNSFGGLKDSLGGSLEAGEIIHYRSAFNPTVLTNSGLQYNPALLAYKQLVDANVDFGLGIPSEGTAITTTVTESGYGLLETLGHVDFQQPGSGEFFIGSENPGVAPVNSWFAIFGQFFDHGLDLIGKGGNGKITIALDPSDPLYGTIGPDGQPVTKITISRATIDGTDVNGDPNYVNHTSPFIDQSQTYGSVDQITQLLRKWESTDSGTSYHAGMELYDGTTLADTWTRRWPDGTTTEVRDTLPTLNELRDHVLDTGRAALTWEDVNDYRNRDANGQVSTGNSGHALILDMNPRFDFAHLNPDDLRGDTDWDSNVTSEVNQAIADLNASGVRNAGALDADILGFTSGGMLSLTLGTALSMGPGPAIAAGTVMTGASALIAAGWVNPANFSITLPAGVLHDSVGEILMAAVGDHYIAGDGRVNENFGLTAIHHVFHEEHNFQVANLQGWIYAHDTNNPGTTDPHEQLHNWQIATATQDASGNYTYGVGGAVAWDSNKMFEATKLIVEMEYQHAAVDQYARTITPRIQEFVGYSSGVDSSISLEYSQVAFRFGHSTIRETIDTIDPSGWMLGNVTRYALEKAFLTPQTFAEEGVAAITLGLARQQMNEVDEFITPALTQGLLGQPLDLAAINIARGRDLGIPTLNDFREGISLARYTSWDDFGKNMVHPESLVNFIAAYSFGGDLAKAEVIMGLLDGSLSDTITVTTGTPPNQVTTVAPNPDAMGFTAIDAEAFILNNTAVNTELNVARDGFNDIDSWIGGLAEAHVPGGLLGETFDAVFVAQIQSLMDGDRFYYLYRLFGTQIHEEVNNGQFKDIVERNTGLSHLNGSIFAYADKYYDFAREADGTEFLDTETVAIGDHANHLYADTLADNPTLGIFSDGGASTDPNGTLISVTASDFVRADVVQNYIRDVRPELDPTQVHTVEGTPTSGADSHEVIVATDNSDYIHGRAGDDTIYGEGGDDYIFADGGVDRLYGGAGNDMLDTGEGPDLADGGSGKDIIYGRGSGAEVGGFDQLVGGTGNDLIIGGEGIDKLSGGSGDDIIYGDGLTNPEMGNTDAFTHGGDGNDYIDTGASGDLLYGEEGDDYMVGGVDQDLMQGGVGDDILRPGSPSQAVNGGPDEVIGDDGFVNSGFDLIDFSDYVAGAPGVNANMVTQFNPLVAIDLVTPFPTWFQIEGVIGSQNNDTFIGTDALNPAEQANPFGGGNWLIGGSGDDTFTGGGGNDLIVGGSMRLDELIGSYTDAVAGNLELGSTAWLADAMATGAGGTGYGNNVEDAYTGASNRTDGTLQTNGLIDASNALGGGQFDKHFVDMLKSRMFKDVMLGDNGTDGLADKAVFSGNRADYTIVTVQAGVYKITDNRDPLAVDVDGQLIPTDGTDLVAGVEEFKFADGTIIAANLVNLPPVFSSNGGGATAAIAIAENTMAVTTVVASDPNPGDTVTYALAGGADEAKFSINATTGELSFIAAPDFETPGSAAGSNVYDVVVQASDGVAVDTQTLSVTVSNVNEPATGLPVIDDATPTAGSVLSVNTAGIVDPDGAIGGITYQWASSSDGTTWTDIAGATGATFTPTNLIGSLTDTYNNQQIHVTVNYTAGGLPGSAVSGVTGPTGANWTATPFAANTFAGTAGDDVIVGTSGVFGFGANDTLSGGLGNDNISGLGGNDTLNGGDGNDLLNGGAGNDIVNGGNGDDIVTYDVVGGRDFIDGGADGTALGDRFVLNGNGSAETFRIYTRAAWIAAAVGAGAQATRAGQLNANTEIVVTRNGLTNGDVISELDNIEEITINGSAASDPLSSGTIGGDTIAVFGDFNQTSLHFNTIHVTGGVGDDTVDISGLTSDHRIVFDGGEGTNEVIGETRSQDVLTNATMAQNAPTDEEDDDQEADHDDDCEDGDDDTSPTPVTVAPTDLTLMGDASENLLTGEGGNDVAMGLGATDTISVGSGDDFVDAGAGDDYVFAGSGNDMIYGGDGADTIMGGDGNDLITAGNGDDDVMGGKGDDTFVAGVADGMDRYSGDLGSDTLDMSAISANIEANLGTGLSGYAQILNGPRDTLYGIENIVTGSGNDTVTASGARNVIDTGAGQDTVVFRSASDADGDTLYNFEAGDRIDVSAFMGGTVSLINGNAAEFGEIAIHFENIGNENFTVLDGLTQDGEHFKIDIKGHHNLTGTDFAA